MESRLWHSLWTKVHRKFENGDPPNGKWHNGGHYPTQANGRLEWGTQYLLPVWKDYSDRVHRMNREFKARVVVCHILRRWRNLQALHGE